MRFLKAPFLVTLLAVATITRSQTVPPRAPVFESIEATAAAERLMTGTVSDYEANRGDWEDRLVTIQVKETLRGPRQSKSIVRLMLPSGQVNQFEQNGNLLLVAAPGDQAQRGSVIDLSDPNLAVLSSDLTLLREPQKVIDAAKAAVREQETTKSPERFDVPIKLGWLKGTSLAKRVDSRWREDKGSLEVPVDKHLEQYASREIRSSEINSRVNGALALSHFNSEGTVRLLKSLLRDKGWQDAYGFDKNKLIHRHYNNVRAAAYHSLQSLGARVDPPVIEDPPDRDGQVMSVELDTWNPSDNLKRNWDGWLTPGSGEAITELPRFRNIENLYLSNGRLTDDQWALVGTLKNLKCLFLEGTNISDDSLKLLDGLQNLRYLALTNTRITDAGLKELAGFKCLKKVDVGWDVSTSGIEELGKARPDLAVRTDPFAFMAALHPRRVEIPNLVSRNYVLPVAMSSIEAVSLRSFAYIFPKETAGEVNSFLAKELPARGWALGGEDYRYKGPPILWRGMPYQVDIVFLTNYTGDVTAGPGERIVGVTWNAGPL